MLSTEFNCAISCGCECFVISCRPEFIIGRLMFHQKLAGVKQYLEYLRVGRKLTNRLSRIFLIFTLLYLSLIYRVEDHQFSQRTVYKYYTILYYTILLIINIRTPRLYFSLPIPELRSTTGYNINLITVRNPCI
jgi:hypothetical protein